MAMPVAPATGSQGLGVRLKPSKGRTRKRQKGITQTSPIPPSCQSLITDELNPSKTTPKAAAHLLPVADLTETHTPVQAARSAKAVRRESNDHRCDGPTSCRIEPAVPGRAHRSAF